jgi:hypothetical protein
MLKLRKEARGLVIWSCIAAAVFLVAFGVLCRIIHKTGLFENDLVVTISLAVILVSITFYCLTLVRIGEIEKEGIPMWFSNAKLGDVLIFYGLRSYNPPLSDLKKTVPPFLYIDCARESSPEKLFCMKIERREPEEVFLESLNADNRIVVVRNTEGKRVLKKLA